MGDSAPNPELLRSLGHLVRGLSALFWGLPAALIICAGTASEGWFKTFGVVPSFAVTGLLLFGLWQLTSFQKQERPWRTALDWAMLFAFINFSHSPFLFWWNRAPENLFFGIIVNVFVFSSVLFLLSLNLVLLRLGQMLPDETLRHETQQFTALNRVLLTGLLFLTGICTYLLRADLFARLDPTAQPWFFRGGVALLIFLGLSPLAITMALIWKTKEVILDSIFSAKS